MAKEFIDHFITEVKRGCSGIYAIVNRRTGSRYIGRAENLRTRKNNHFKNLRKNQHFNKKLQRAYNKDPNVFVFVVLFVCPKQSLKLHEQLCLNYLQPEYNISKDSTAPMEGVKHTEEAKAKIGNFHKGNNRLEGYKHTDEHNENISRGHKRNRKRKKYCATVKGQKQLRENGLKSNTPENQALRAAGTRRFMATLSAEERISLYGRQRAPRSTLTRVRMQEARLRLCKPVRCLNDGAEYPHITAAAEFYGLKKGNISSVCCGRQKTTGGLRFEYIDKPDAK